MRKKIHDKEKERYCVSLLPEVSPPQSSGWNNQSLLNITQEVQDLLQQLQDFQFQPHKGCTNNNNNNNSDEPKYVHSYHSFSGQQRTAMTVPLDDGWSATTSATRMDPNSNLNNNGGGGGGDGNTVNDSTTTQQSAMLEEIWKSTMPGKPNQQHSKMTTAPPPYGGGSYNTANAFHNKIDSMDKEIDIFSQSGSTSSSTSTPYTLSVIKEVDSCRTTTIHADNSKNDTINTIVSDEASICDSYFGIPVNQASQLQEQPTTTTTTIRKDGEESTIQLHQQAKVMFEAAQLERDMAYRWVTQLRKAVYEWIQHQKELLNYYPKNSCFTNTDAGTNWVPALQQQQQEQQQQQLIEQIQQLQQQIQTCETNHQTKEERLHTIIQKQQQVIQWQQKQLQDYKIHHRTQSCHTKIQNKVQPSRAQQQQQSTSTIEDTTKNPTSATTTTTTRSTTSVPHSPLSQRSSGTTTTKKKGTVGTYFNYSNGARKEVYDTITMIRYPNGDCCSETALERAYYYAQTGIVQFRRRRQPEQQQSSQNHQYTTSTMQKDAKDSWDDVTEYHYPNGQIEEHWDDGTKLIQYPDGTRLQYDATNGEQLRSQLS